ncbi:hypothetical protein [Sphingobium sp. YC-XJ3]|uniref:hypothetical protein n=1 Tax=Sphingobium sp. YC-XJ3 TaxID=3024245 RepID=UPI0023606F88|nr:hypothetical protein [Sphingobium sp. YC-XJ3]WDA36433.1 hypothetical protein PO876_23890 [Sphingobium sp. YC-XJ3]WDA37837.1 hypothetical protein PO876_06560 [Sphingobium sp. YC-XJ3]
MVKYSELVERLRELRPIGELTAASDFDLVNPSGPEAADAITKLEAEKAELVEGLKEIVAFKLTLVDGRLDGCSKASLRVDIRTIRNMARATLAKLEEGQ